MHHTHKIITSKFLRGCFAAELWHARRGLRMMPIEERSSLRYGMESGIWAVQKGLIYDRIG